MYLMYFAVVTLLFYHVSDLLTSARSFIIATPHHTQVVNFLLMRKIVFAVQY